MPTNASNQYYQLFAQQNSEQFENSTVVFSVDIPRAAFISRTGIQSARKTAMHHCFACSSYDVPKRRRRKKTLIGCTKNQNKATTKSTPCINFQSIGELAVLIDPTIVNKYFKAKRTIDEIIRPVDRQESYLAGYPRVNVNNNDELLPDFSTQTIPPAFSTSNGLFVDPCISIKEELSEERSIEFYDDETPLESRMVEIPIDSNIVLNPMNNRVTFSQLNDNEADDSQPQPTVPKYVYNPMNNIVTSSQNCDESDDNNNSDQPSDMPADVQFAPGEYVLEDDFLNDNYDVVNAFALEPVDVDSNQNALTVSEHSDKEQSLLMKMVDAIVNPDVVRDDDDDLLENKEMETSETLSNPAIEEQEESILHDEGDQKKNVETECEEFACGKCNKKFKLPYYLRKHELTCGMTFHYNCLYCTKSSMLSHTIKCHMSNRHVEQVAIYGMKELMEIVIKRRRENKETNLNAQQSEEILVLPDVGGNFVLMDNLKKYQRSNKRKQTFPKARKNVGIDQEDYTFEIKKEILENDLEKESTFPSVEVSHVSNNDVEVCMNFKPSKVYVDALCSNCNVHLKNLKSGAIKCCPNCQSPLIYKCVVCRKCFSKYLSICGHVKYHPQSNLSQIANLDDKHYCGYCSYETVLKSQLLRHLLGHVREKSVKIKREYSG